MLEIQITRISSPSGPLPVAAGADRGGQACWLLGPVGCDDRSPCTSGLSTWWSSRSLHTPWVMETSS